MLSIARRNLRIESIIKEAEENKQADLQLAEEVEVIKQTSDAGQAAALVQEIRQIKEEINNGGGGDAQAIPIPDVESLINTHLNN